MSNHVSQESVVSEPIPPYERRAEYQQMPALLARIGAQLEHALTAQTELKADIKALSVSVNADIKELREAIDTVPGTIEAKLKDYTRLDVFSPVQTLVYSLIGLVLAGIVGVLGTVIMRSGGVR